MPKKNQVPILQLEKPWHFSEKQALLVILLVLTHLSQTASLLIYAEMQQNQQLKMAEAKEIPLGTLTGATWLQKGSRS